MSEQPNGKKCLNCRYWSGDRKFGGFGECLKRAPVAVEGHTRGVVEAKWPRVHSIQLCGEWEFADQRPE